jgi:di/tricarboxylate transporter
MDPALFVALVLCAALFCFISGCIPLGATALFVDLALYLGGIIDAKTALKDFSSQNVMIIAGLAIVGEAMFRTGAAAQVGIFLKKVAKSERILVFWLVMGSGILSGFLSNNGCAALIMALTLGICLTTGFRRCKLMYPIAVGICYGGGMTTVGSNSTLYLKGILEGLGPQYTMDFFELAPLCLILTFVSAIFLATVGFNLMPEESFNKLDPSYAETPDYSKIPAWKRKLSFVIFIATILGMCFEKQIGISVGMTALIATFVIVATGLLTDKEAFRAIPMTAVLMYACMVPVSKAMVTSGASKYIVAFMQSLLGGTDSSLIVILLIYAVIVPLTNVMSNSATVIMFTPVALAVAASMNMNPKAVLMTLRMAATIAVATPISMTPTTMAVEPGGYRFIDFLKPGIPICIITMIISMIYIYFVYPIHA